MSLSTVTMAGRRIAEHALAHRLPVVCVVLHGGEPLLLGAEQLRTRLAALRNTVRPVTALDLRLQTNGVLLTPAICDVLAEYEVSVGVSLDGDRQANDRHRLFASGQSSYPQVRRALSLLRQPEYHRLYGGILCTVDVWSDPLRVYAALLAEQPPRIDFLLPHATWELPPSRPPGAAAPYAQWLGTIHERWLADGRPVPIRLFDSLHATAVGGSSLTEWVGLEPATIATIETNGDWEQVDSLKTAYHGAAATGMDIFSHSVDDAAAHPAIAGRQSGPAGVCDTCRSCNLVHRCGGGLLAHRYRADNGFDNPSVYCEDIKVLVAQMDSASAHSPPMARTGSSVLAEPILDDLATGWGTTASIDLLSKAELAISRALVTAVQTKALTASSNPQRTMVMDGWTLLTQLDHEAPTATLAVLSHPYTRTWAIRCLQRGGDPSRPSETGYAHLANLAASSAVIAGVAAQIVVPVTSGAVHLPGVGALLLEDQGSTTATVHTNSAGFTIRIEDHEYTIDTHPPSAWRPYRGLGCPGLTVKLVDTDPFRDVFGWPLADGSGQLPSTLAGAWISVQRDTPWYGPSVSGVLRVLTPLTSGPAGSARSGSSRDAYGAIGVDCTTDVDTLAELLVHEVQHAKFGAVLDLCDLVDPASTTHVRVGWRPDPRPVEAALTGAYAHLAVADLARTHADQRGSTSAEQRRDTYLEWVTSALEIIQGSQALTRSGERFVARMSAVVNSWT